MFARFRFLAIPLALIAGVLAQVLFDAAAKSAPVRLAPACIMAALAIGLFAWAAPAFAEPQTAPGASAPKWFSRRPWVLAQALGAGILALGLSMAREENALVRGLWLTSLILLVLAYAGRDALPRLSREDGIDILLISGLTLAGFVLRFWQLPNLPSYFHGDIASQGLQALELMAKPNPQWFSVGWSNIPMFDFVMMTWAMRLFGADLFGLSMTAVLQGVLTIPALYLLGRELFGRRLGLLAAALLTINYTHIHFSRIVTTASPLLSMCFTFYFLFRALRLRHGLWFALAGLSLGLGLLVYYPVRVSVIVVVLLFAWLMLWKRPQLRADLPSWLAFCLGAALAFGPMWGYVYRQFGAFVGRGSEVMIWNPTVLTHLRDKYATNSLALIWLEQIKRSFLTFFLYPDSSTHFSFLGPMVSALTAVLLLLGLGLALRRLRDPRLFALLMWGGLTLILGGVITNDPPFWPHLVVVLPPVMLLAALGAERAWAGLIRILPTARRPQANFVAGSVLAMAILLSGVQGWQSYVGWVGDNATPEVHVARYLASLPRDRHVVLVSDPLSLKQRELEFLGQGLSGEDMKTEDVLALPAPSTPTAFILSPNHAGLLPSLQERIPGGELTEHWADAGWLAFYSYEITPPGYIPAPDVTIPAESLLARRRIVWALAGVLLILAAGAGVYVSLRQPVAIDPEAAPPLVASTPPPTAPRPAALAKVTALPPAAAMRSSNTSTIALREQIYTRRRLFLALAGVLFALFLAYLGQRFYDGRLGEGLTIFLATKLSLDVSDRGRLLAGTVLYGMAMILFAVAAPGWPRLVAIVQAQLGTPRPAAGKLSPDARIVRPQSRMSAPTAKPSPAALTLDRPRWTLLALALAPYVASMLLFAAKGENSLVRWLWALGLVIFGAGQVLWPAFRASGADSGERSPRFRWLHVAILAAILAGGFWLRFNRLDTIPDDFHGDMASMGLQARDLLTTAQPALFREGWANIPMLGFIPSALGLRLFGNNLFGLNMSAVLMGMLSLLGLYLLTWRLFDSHRLAAMAMAILAINIPHIHFSRLAAYMDPWPFLLFATFFIVDGLRARRLASLATAGVLLGFGLQMYYSGRVIIFILAAALIYLLLVRRDWILPNWRGLILVIVGLLLAIGPSLIYFYRHPEPFVERSRAVFLFFEPVMTHLKGKYGVTTSTAVLLEQFKRSLLIFNQSTDSSTQFGYPHPMFSSLLSPLVVLGFGYSLRRWRNPGVGLSLIWLLIMLGNGSILTGDAPFWPRLVGILPAAAILAALALDRLWVVVGQLPAQNQRRLVQITCAAVAALFLTYAGRQNWQEYFTTVEHNVRSQAMMGRYLSSLPPEVAACGFQDPYALSVRETYFLAWPRQVVDLPSDAPATFIEQCPGPPFVWILTDNHVHRLSELQQRWPGGEVENHTTVGGFHVFTSYLVQTGEPSQASSQPISTPVLPPGEGAPAPAVAVNVPALLPDGRRFQPQQTFLGDSSGATWVILAGGVKVTGGRFQLMVGPVPGHDAVYDYFELLGADGSIHHFEAEDASITSGDAFASFEGVDGHWWRQKYDPFSGSQGLVGLKTEPLPVLVSTVAVPDGEYDLTIGSFKGDLNNGVFGLGVSWTSGAD